MMEVNSETLALMTNEELINFAVSIVGISVKPSWRREVVITHIMKAASYCEDT